MDEFGAEVLVDEDWDNLQAGKRRRRSSDLDEFMLDLVQSSCSFSSSSRSLGTMNMDEYYYVDDQTSAAATTSFLDELILDVDQLYKLPFDMVINNMSSYNHALMLGDHKIPSNTEESAVKEMQLAEVVEEPGEEEGKKVKKRLLSSLDQRDETGGEAGAAATPTKRRLTRKSKGKVKVVHRTSTKDDSSALDKWNWRKYGQKPIKGSPYPRSYYRCSTSVGCQAKKQVEQSGSEPETCIITYISEHNHALPTRRATSNNHAAGKARRNVSPPSHNYKYLTNGRRPLPGDDQLLPISSRSVESDEKKQIMMMGNEEEDREVVSCTDMAPWEEDSTGSVLPMLDLYEAACLSAYDHLHLPLEFMTSS